MRQSARWAPAWAILVAGLLPLAAHAGDQSQVNLVPAFAAQGQDTAVILAQALPQAAPTSGPSPGNGGSASGISTNPSNNTTGVLASRALPLPISGPPLIGPFPSVGRTLLDIGIDVHGIAFDHFRANPTAGNITGQTYNLAALAPVIDFDLGKILGLTRGNIHTQITMFGLRSNIPNIITDVGGFLTGFQTTPDPSTASIVLSVLTYEQKLLDGKLSIEAGRTNAYQYFLLPNGLDFFNDFSSTFNLDGDFNSNPFPVWGGRATYHFTPNNSGAQILGEVAYRSEFDSADYPANFELGTEWNTRHGTYNIKGAVVLATPFNQATDYHGGGILFFEGRAGSLAWRQAAIRSSGQHRAVGVGGRVAGQAAADRHGRRDGRELHGVPSAKAVRRLRHRCALSTPERHRSQLRDADPDDLRRSRIPAASRQLRLRGRRQHPGGAVARDRPARAVFRQSGQPVRSGAEKTSERWLRSGDVRHQPLGHLLGTSNKPF